VVKKVVFSIAGMSFGQNIGFSMECVVVKNVVFSLDGMCLGQISLFSAWLELEPCRTPIPMGVGSLTNSKKL
jgi:hypothetical protein